MRVDMSACVCVCVFPYVCCVYLCRMDVDASSVRSKLHYNTPKLHYKWHPIFAMMKVHFVPFFLAAWVNIAPRGCFSFSRTSSSPIQGNRVAQTLRTHISLQTADSCASLCSRIGYPFSGIGASFDCWCMSEVPQLPSSTACTVVACLGTFNQPESERLPCGNTVSIAVYAVQAGESLPVNSNIVHTAERLAADLTPGEKLKIDIREMWN